jgi:elongation factor G
MDREGADFEGTLQEIRDRLESNPIPIQIPVGSGPPHMQNAFRGIIDLIEMKMLTFEKDKQGSEIITSEIPAEFRDEADIWRADMLERLFNFSNELGELLLAETEVPAELIRRVLRETTIGRLVVPVLCGSALDHTGVQPVLDAVMHFLPSPADLPPVEGTDVKDETKTLLRKPLPSEPFSGLVFKVQADKHGDLCYVRVYSGTLKGNSRVYNPREEKKENCSQLWHIQADRREQVERVEAGDIVGIIGLRNSVTGDTLCDAAHPILLMSITFPETVISMAIEPESTAERKKLADTLEMLKRQDPTFRARESEDTGQTLISGMGELHLEIIKNRLLRDFKLNVRVHKPRVSYRETIQRAVNVVGECQSQAGQPQFAKVAIRMEPFDGEKPVTVLNQAGDAIPAQYIKSVMETLEQEADGGGSLSFPLMRVKITVTGGEASETESSEIAFRKATVDAFRSGLREGGIVLLEPIMKLEITTPEEYMGDFISDLQQRRALITNTQARGSKSILEADAPLSNLFGYSNAMRGLSQGRATCSMEPHTYSPAPAEILESFM